MSAVRLSDADRERFGVDEWLDYDLGRLTVVEAETLQERFGVDPDDRFVWFRGAPVVKDGQPVTGDDGEPVYRRSVVVYRFLVWVALRRAGCVQDPDSLDFDYDDLQFRRAPDPKDQSSPAGASDS